MSGVSLPTIASLEVQRGQQIWVKVAIAGAVLLGVALRLRQYFFDYSYWSDPAYLLLNILKKSWTAVAFGPLDVSFAPQAAPPGFVWAVKGIATFFSPAGTNELAIEFVPLVASCMAILVFPIVVRRFIASQGVILGITAVMAISPRLVTMAATLKQYSSDVLVAEILLLAGAWAVTAGGQSLRRIAVFAAIATPLFWCSHTAVFCFASISGVLLFQARRKWAAAAILLVAATSFIAVYWLSVRPQQDPYFYVYWSNTFVPWRTPWRIPNYLARNFWGHFDYIASGAGLLLGGAIFAGVRLFWPGGRWAAGRGGAGDVPLGRETEDYQVARANWVMLAGNLLLVLAAAAAGKFVFRASRPAMFLIPVCLLLGGMGLDLLRGRWRYLRWMIVFPLIFGGAQIAQMMFGKTNIADGRSRIVHAYAHLSAGEKVITLEPAAVALAQIYGPQDAKIDLILDGDVRTMTGDFWLLVISGREEKGRLAGAIRNVGIEPDAASSIVGESAQALHFIIPAGKTVRIAGVMTLHAARDGPD